MGTFFYLGLFVLAMSFVLYIIRIYPVEYVYQQVKTCEKAIKDLEVERVPDPVKKVLIKKAQSSKDDWEKMLKKSTEQISGERKGIYCIAIIGFILILKDLIPMIVVQYGF